MHSADSWCDNGRRHPQQWAMTLKHDKIMVTHLLVKAPLLQVGGRLGGVFDEDPRRWRMIAVGFATVGLALEIATTAFPSYFLLLAGTGTFTKAVGKGLSQPCFRIIQNHFAAANNVGDISAKEEVRPKNGVIGEERTKGKLARDKGFIQAFQNLCGRFGRSLRSSWAWPAA